MNVIVEKCAVNAGEGFRTVIWCFGCEKHCPGCHNQESWNKENGKVFNYPYVNKVINYVKDNDFIKGITLTGGDPLETYNIEAVTNFLNIFKNLCPDKDVWCWTGCLWEDVKDLAVMQYIDVLIDGPFIQELRDITLEWKGSSNQRVIDVQKSLKQNKIILYGEE